MESTTKQPTDDSRKKNFSGYGYCLLALGITLGGVGRTLRISGPVAIGVSVASLLAYALAIVMFVKAGRPNRKSSVVAVVIAALVAAVTVIAVVTSAS